MILLQLEANVLDLDLLWLFWCGPKHPELNKRQISELSKTELLHLFGKLEGLCSHWIGKNVFTRECCETISRIHYKVVERSS